MLFIDQPSMSPERAKAIATAGANVPQKPWHFHQSNDSEERVSTSGTDTIDSLLHAHHGSVRALLNRVSGSKEC